MKKPLKKKELSIDMLKEEFKKKLIVRLGKIETLLKEIKTTLASDNFEIPVAEKIDDLTIQLQKTKEAYDLAEAAQPAGPLKVHRSNKIKIQTLDCQFFLGSRYYLIPLGRTYVTLDSFFCYRYDENLILQGKIALPSCFAPTLFFVNETETEIILFDIDENMFFHADFDNGMKKAIKLSKEVIPTPLYAWQKNTLLIFCSKIETFVEIDIESESIHYCINISDTQKKYPILYAIFNKSNGFEIKTFNQKKLSFTSLDPEKKEAIYYQYPESTFLSVNYTIENPFTACYANQIFYLLDQEELEVRLVDTNKYAIITPPFAFRFSGIVPLNQTSDQFLLIAERQTSPAISLMYHCRVKL